MRRAATAVLALLLGGCASAGSARRTAADEAYARGAADAVKQLYWARQALEAPRESRLAGRTEYYVWEESGTCLLYTSLSSKVQENQSRWSSPIRSLVPMPAVLFSGRGCMGPAGAGGWPNICRIALRDRTTT